MYKISELPNKKLLALILKDICGNWISSRYDPIHSVSKLGIESFNNAFAEAKRDEVLSFTKDSLISFVKTTLFETSIETLRKKGLTR
jgi:hypothetical protein